MYISLGFFFLVCATENVRTPEGRNATRRFKNHKFEASSIYSYLNTTTSELPSVIMQLVIVDPFPCVFFRFAGALLRLTAGFEAKRFEGNHMGRMWCIFIMCVYGYIRIVTTCSLVLGWNNYSVPFVVLGCLIGAYVCGCAFRWVRVFSSRVP